MSRPISESLSLLSETLGNCKNNLKEKEVADVDNIKISDIDEKIAEIQSGGGGGKATIVVVSSLILDYMDSVRLVEMDPYKLISYSDYFEVYNKNKLTTDIKIYEVEPSDKAYYLYYEEGDSSHYTEAIYFNEPKLYVLKSDECHFEG